MTPTALRVEHLDEALGITEREPRLSWRLPAGTSVQTAYRVRAGTWDSGRVESSQSLLVPYEGAALRSRERVQWTVKVWTDAGESEWAQPAWWEMGLLEPSDWSARFVEPVEDADVQARAPRPAWRLRGSFQLDRPVVSARLYATAHGVYECFLNGRRVGDMELTPGFTSYRSNLQVQAFDVTDLLVRGENVLGAIVSDGWYRGQLCGYRLTDFYGDRVGLLAQLHVDRADGSSACFGTGPDWVAATGSILAADLMEGQVTDLREQASGWSPVAVADHDLARLRSSPSPPVRRVQELRPVAVTRPRPDRQIVDLGQNVNGWVRLRTLGPAGTTLTLTHGEALGSDGDVTLDNVRSVHDVELPGDRWSFENMRRPLQVDRVTAAGDDGEAFEPRHTTHGFRYVRVEGHPDALEPDDVTGVVVHTDLRRTGWFECSDLRINRLHEAAVWSLRGNVCDIPTDCPTRERAGWAGDWQLYVPVAAFLYDVAGFSAKWLRDLAAEQEPDGLVHDCVPNPAPAEVLRAIGIGEGSAGWGDAAVIVPWEVHRAYGDVRLLEEQWPSMVAWVENRARAARERRHPNRVAARPEPAPHEAFLLDTGFHFGEWLEPKEFAAGFADGFLDDMAARRSADNADVATAYLHRSAAVLADIAAVLGRPDEEARYTELAAATRTAWQAECVLPDGSLARDTQANHVRALAFRLVHDELRPRTARRLVELVRQAGTHVGTGFLATPYLLPTLADNGHLDVAYELLLGDTEPSWLTMIDRGATTIWELWNGIDAAGHARGSLNHYSKGAVISFLHSYVAGIRLIDGEPAYRRFRIAPRPGGGVRWARAAHDSPYGRIESSWWVEDERFVLDVLVPPGSSAEVILPDGRCFEAPPGAATYRGGLRMPA